MSETKANTTVNVRGINMSLLVHTRSLELCARMNRELEVLDFIDSIPANNVLYDLGSAEGRFAIYAALQGIQTYAFEPEQLNYETLLENMQLNSSRLIECLYPFQVALGKTNEEAILNIGQPWAGGHQKIVESDTGRGDLQFNFTQQQRIKVVSLDSFIDTEQLPPPNYLKVDIDGSELSFLAGAERTLKMEALRGIMIELYQPDTSCDLALSILGNYGFEVVSKHEIDNEPGLLNIWLQRNQLKM